MAFVPLQYDSGKLVKLPAYNGGSSATYTKGDALIASGGYVSAASSGTATDIFYVAMETKTVTVDGTLLLCLPVEGVRFEADCDAVWSIVDRFTLCDLATVSTLNPDASSNDLFLIEEGVGAAESGTKVRGYFWRGTPQS